MLLFSGGTDSCLLFEKARRQEILHSCIFFDYDQPVLEQERKAAMKWCNTHQIDYYEQRVDINPSPMYTDEEGASRFVPERNLIFLSIASNIAQFLGCTHIWYGAIKDDYHDYKDCRPEWIESLNQLVGDIIIEAPLQDMTKSQVLEELSMMGISKDDCWSCYQSENGEPCGKCNSCLLVNQS